MALFALPLDGLAQGVRGYRPLHWQSDVQVSDTNSDVRQLLEALPLVQPQRWGYQIAWDTLAGEPIVAVQAMIGAGTGAGQEAFYVFTRDSEGRRALIWSALALYYQAPSPATVGPRFEIAGCLYRTGDGLAYELVPDSTAAARDFLRVGADDYFPSEHLERRPGIYHLEMSTRKFVREGDLEAGFTADCQKVVHF